MAIRSAVGAGTPQPSARAAMVVTGTVLVSPAAMGWAEVATTICAPVATPKSVAFTSVIFMCGKTEAASGEAGGATGAASTSPAPPASSPVTTCLTTGWGAHAPTSRAITKTPVIRARMGANHGHSTTGRQDRGPDLPEFTKKHAGHGAGAARTIASLPVNRFADASCHAPLGALNAGSPRRSAAGKG